MYLQRYDIKSVSKVRPTNTLRTKDVFATVTQQVVPMLGAQQG